MDLKQTNTPVLNQVDQVEQSPTSLNNQTIALANSASSGISPYQQNIPVMEAPPSIIKGFAIKATKLQMTKQGRPLQNKDDPSSPPHNNHPTNVEAVAKTNQNSKLAQSTGHAKQPVAAVAHLPPSRPVYNHLLSDTMTKLESKRGIQQWTGVLTSGRASLCKRSPLRMRKPMFSTSSNKAPSSSNGCFSKNNPSTSINIKR